MTPSPKVSIKAAVKKGIGHSRISRDVDGVKRHQQVKTQSTAQSSEKLQVLLSLEAQMRAQRSVSALSLWVVNELRTIVDYSQCIFLRLNKSNKSRVQSVSSLASVDRHAPFIRLVEQRVDEALKANSNTGPEFEDAAVFGISLHQSLEEQSVDRGLSADVVYPFQKAILLPLRDFDGQVFGALLFARRNHWTEKELVVVTRIGESFSHSFQSLVPKRKLKPFGLSKWIGICIAVLIVAAMFIPVPMSVMAPAEIVAEQPYIIAAPIDGVIKTIQPEANSMVLAGDVLFVLEDTLLRSDAEVARRKELVSQARLTTAKQTAFSDPAAYKQLAINKAEVALAKAERVYAEDRLQRTIVRARQSGLLIYSNKKDWLGKPVRTGERIMEIADRDHVQIRIDLPVGDVIGLQKNARVRFFLDANPLEPLAAKVVRASYRAKDVPGIGLVYQIVAALDETLDETLGEPLEPATRSKKPRIGLRGTAQILGETVFLGFYLFRKPISAARQYMGI